MQSLDAHDEKLLLHRTAEGDETAFTRLFDAYHHTLGAFIFGITKSKELAEEIVLDIFLKIWMTREALAGIKDFRAYLFTISRNAAISALRKVIQERTRLADWQAVQNPEMISEENHREHYLSLVDEAINQLSPQRKKIFLLSRNEGLKYEEIARQTGISRFTVRAHIQQAVASIAEYLKARMQGGLLLGWI
ncbi:MAG TPA: sigma-70 family RNA polymerase sigma factor, partial [Flavisolibacter sp.]|nr:sigma-70 family RNA polymerase sigma factor [Flavisolibacter sp.]